MESTRSHKDIIFFYHVKKAVDQGKTKADMPTPLGTYKSFLLVATLLLLAGATTLLILVLRTNATKETYALQTASNLNGNNMRAFRSVQSEIVTGTLQEPTQPGIIGVGPQQKTLQVTGTVDHVQELWATNLYGTVTQSHQPLITALATLSADLQMNGKDIQNVGSLQADSITGSLQGIQPRIVQTGVFTQPLDLGGYDLTCQTLTATTIDATGVSDTLLDGIHALGPQSTAWTFPDMPVETGLIRVTDMTAATALTLRMPSLPFDILNSSFAVIWSTSVDGGLGPLVDEGFITVPEGTTTTYITIVTTGIYALQVVIAETFTLAVVGGIYVNADPDVAPGNQSTLCVATIPRQTVAFESNVVLLRPMAFSALVSLQAGDVLRVLLADEIDPLVRWPGPTGNGEFYAQWSVAFVQ
jgi:hypothetical protein